MLDSTKGFFISYDFLNIKTQSEYVGLWGPYLLSALRLPPVDPRLPPSEFRFPYQGKRFHTEFPITPHAVSQKNPRGEAAGVFVQAAVRVFMN
jgi:hypothetical protein